MPSRQNMTISSPETTRNGQWQNVSCGLARYAAGQHSYRRVALSGAWPDANFNFAHIKRLIQKLEAGKFDAFFHGRPSGRAEHADIGAQAQPHRYFVEPFTCCRRYQPSTEHIGLIATGSTTFDEPYHVARRFASLDHISGGRAGWNIVTTSNPDAALNFGLEDHMEHAERYKRAREFYDVVTGLWDSFADDAFVRDVEAGLYFDPAKMHLLNHKENICPCAVRSISPVRCRAGR